jgi:hypothetical protein
MFARPKFPVFIDAVVLEIDQHECPSALKAVLKDEKGSIMSSLDAAIEKGQTNLSWKGLNDLPYGVYSLELSDGEQETRVRMIKRV